MLEPSGPLPPEIYWRRRALAIAVVVVVVAVIIGLIVWASGGSDSPRNTSASVTPSSSTSQSLPPYASDSAVPGSGTEGSGGSGGSGGGPGQVPASTNASGVVVPGSTTPSANPTAVPASGLCPDQNISVVLYTDKPTYTVGDKPVFTIVVTNAGLADCTRDVGKDMQNVTVRSLDGTRYIWSATDCSPIATVNNQTLKPAQQFKDTIVWSGTTSAPGCKTPRVAAPAGSYQAVGNLGTKVSAPITFNVTDPPSR